MGLLLLPSFWNIVSAQKDDDAVKGLFKIALDAKDESIANISWGDNLPYYSGGCGDKVHLIEISAYYSPNYIHIHGKDYFESRPSSGIAPMQIGPSKNIGFEIRYEWGSPNGGCSLKWGYEYLTITTPAIKPPTDVDAHMISDTSAEISWKKGSGIVEHSIQYLIKRNGVEIARVRGDLLSYVDTTIAKGTMDVLYTVQTIVGEDAPARWNRTQSSEVQAPALNLRLEATTTESNRIKLTWPELDNVHGVEAVIIVRNGVDIERDYSKHATSYTDYEVIAGMAYTYQLRFRGTQSETIKAVGRSKPNGKISGYVRNSTGIGIAGIDITASSTAEIDDNVESKQYMYTATTEHDGYYEIPEIFYGDAASYQVVPKLPGYDLPRFNPDTLVRNLDIDEYNIKNVSFEDTASFTVAGQVYFYLSNSVSNSHLKLGMDSVDIYVDGVRTATTKPDGTYALNFASSGTYHIAAAYRQHKIRPLAVHADQDTLTTGVYPVTGQRNELAYGYDVLVESDVGGINFINLQTDTLELHVYATDGKFPVGEEILMDIRPIDGYGAPLPTRVFPPLPVYANGNTTSLTDTGPFDNDPGNDIHGGLSTADWTDANTYVWNGQPVHIKTDNPGNTNGSAVVVLPALAYEIYATHIIERNDPDLPYSNANALVNTNKQEFFRKLKQRISLAERDTVEAFRDSVILDPPQDEIRTIVNQDHDPDDPASGPYEIQDTIRAGEFGLDTMHMAYREATNPNLRFVYHQELDIVWDDEADWDRNNLLQPGKLEPQVINQWGAARSKYSDKLYLLEQGVQELLRFRVVEAYDLYGEAYQHPVDSAIIEIYDGIGDFNNAQRYRYLPHDPASGRYQPFTYQLVPGAPNFSVAPFHEKSFQLFAKVGMGTSQLTHSKTLFATVVGSREEEGKGVVSSPNIPYLILHRPPGDQSYARIKKGSQFTWRETKKYGTSGGAGINASLGFNSNIFGVNLFGRVETSLVAGRNNEGDRGFQHVFTVEEEIATSPDGEFNAGKGGDILFFNTNVFSYGIYNHLVYEPQVNGGPGKLSHFQAADLADRGMESIVMYTYNQVKNTEIPRLENLIGHNNTQISIDQNKPQAQQDTSETNRLRNEINRYREQIRVYNKVLHNVDSIQALANGHDGELAPFYEEMVQEVMQNKLDSAEASSEIVDRLKNHSGDMYAMQKNITFSNGVDYSFTLQNSMTYIDNFEYEVYIDWDLTATGGIQVGENDLTRNEVGASATVHTIVDGTILSREGEINNEIEIFLSDDDIGDSFSLNTYVDPTYKTPIFGVYGGASSCPYEIGTLQRDLPVIAVSGNSKLVNVPADEPATFTVSIGNESVTEEAREYIVFVNPRSNPNGARVYLGGTVINNTPASFFVQPQDSARITLEVYRGPIAYQYNNLELVIAPACSDIETRNVDDSLSKASVYISAHFTPSCGTVDLFKPGHNWLVSSLNHNRLQVTFNEYDPNNPNLREIRLQYRRKTGQQAGTVMEDWVDVVSVTPSQLTDAFYDYLMDVSGLPDGDYELRATSVCTDGYYYSDVYAGTIDRTSVNIYGLPEPANGIYGIGSGIRVAFNTTLAASQPTLSVWLEEDGTGTAIPVTYAMNAQRNEISITPVTGDGAFDLLETKQINAFLTGAIADNANEQRDTIQWSFIVNRSPVYWNPASIDIVAEANADTAFGAMLSNKTAANHSFTITEYPQWLTPTITSGNVVPFGGINIDFAIDNRLNPGTYQDTVAALINDKSQYLIVTVNVIKASPDWQVNPADFSHQMNIVAQFSRDETDLLLSRDILDKIAVFVGDEPRGVANITYEPTYDRYVAYLTAYSNNPAGERLSFRLWDAIPGLEYESAERLDFATNGHVGNVNMPYIAHAAGIYQSIPLRAGWNWLSLYVEGSDMSTDNVLKHIDADDQAIIKTLFGNSSYSQFTAIDGWVGTLDTLYVYQSYMMYLSHADTLKVFGQLPETAVMLTLNQGWNWLGYPRYYNTDINTYFGSAMPGDKDKIVGQDGFAEYDAAAGQWFGSLRYLQPNHGYRYYSQHGLTFEVGVPDPAPAPTRFMGMRMMAAGTARALAQTPQININPFAVVTSSVDPTVTANTIERPYHSTLTSTIMQDGMPVTDPENYEVWVRVNGELVNIVTPISGPDETVNSFIPVFGDDTETGQKIELVVHDKSRGQVYEAYVIPSTNEGMPYSPSHAVDLRFEADAVSGTVQQPMAIVLEGAADLSLSRSVEQTEVMLNGTFSYVIRVSNPSAEVAVNVALSDTVAAAFDVVSISGGAQFDSGSRTVKQTISALQPGEEREIVLQLQALQVGTHAVGHGQVTANNDRDASNDIGQPVLVNVSDTRADAERLFIPGLFTPNGDGINDFFEIVGLPEYFPENELVIYNKNYNTIYKKVNYRNDWGGDNQPMGSYGYILKVKTATGEEKIYKGFITITY